tara:strand:- start:233 stop:871 length:639 start_codon:yes stop_codon:yes gene_type:complete
MKVVKVYGALKKRLGQSRFEFDVATPAEAVRALCANFPGLQKWVIDSEQDGVGYKVKVGKEVIEEKTVEGLHHPWSERDVFSITPVVSGAGRGFGKILAGALLIGASFFFPGAGMFGKAGAEITGGAVTGFWGGVGTFTSAVGASLVLNGVSDMLVPPPEFPDMKQANTLANFSFSGVTNTAQVGTPVPIAYGRLYVGSSVISSGLDVDQVI